MTDTRQCPECGGFLPADGRRGLCAQCALDRALAMTHGNSQVHEVAETATLPRPQPPPPPLLTGNAPLGLFGEYELLEEIARGGMGIVFKARQRSLGRTVAVKLILGGPLAGKEFVQRFRAEASAAALLQHPNIVAIHEVGVHEGQHYFSMDCVEGQNLAQLVGAQPLHPVKAARYVKEIAEAIHYAHERGILHRDLKPSNVLIDSATDQPRVTDFGLAKRLDGDSSLTQSGQVLGSPNFMPPEQAGGAREKVGRPSDVYALGGILYYLLTARPPFQADSLEHTLAQVLHADPVAPRLLDPSVPRDVETIALKCLEKEPSRRYQSAREVAEELNRFLTHEPIRARPITPPEKLWRWSRRKPALASLIVLLHLVGAAGLGGILWQLRQSKHQLYVARMNLTQAAWEQNNVRRAKELLEETEAAPERGFEWLYWQRQLHLELQALRGHTGPILSVDYSPDGSRIVTGSADHTARVWDAAAGRTLLTLAGHDDAIRSVAFFPDGRRIVTGSWDKTARVWDAETGKMLGAFSGHSGPIFSVAVSMDTGKIVTGSFDRTARVWDAATFETIATFAEHTNSVLAVAFSPDGSRVVSGGWDQTGRVWDARSGNELLRLAGHTGAVFAVAFSPDGGSIVTGGDDHRAKVWDAASGNLRRVLRHGAPVLSVEFFPESDRILTSSDDQTARVWDLDSGEETRVFKGHGSLIGSAACSPDGRRIVTGGGGVRFAPNGAFFGRAAGDDQTAKVWDVEGGQEPRTLLGHTNAVVSLDFSPDGRRLVSGSFDGTARVWDTDSGWAGRIVGRHAGQVRAVAFLPDNRKIVTGGFDHTARIWDLASGNLVHELNGHSDVVFSVAASPSGQWIATGSWDGTVKLWDASTGKLACTLHQAQREMFPVVFSPDNRRLAGGNEDGMLIVWELASRKVRMISRDTAKIWSLAYSTDGRSIVTGNHDLSATVWNAGGGKRLSLKGHAAQVHSAVFSPDGSRIVTGSADRLAKLWNSATGDELLTLKGHTGPVIAVAFSPDGQRIATGSADHSIKIWEGATEEQVTRWRSKERAGSAEALASTDAR